MGRIRAVAVSLSLGRRGGNQMKRRYVATHLHTAFSVSSGVDGKRGQQERKVELCRGLVQEREWGGTEGKRNGEKQKKEGKRKKHSRSQV